MKIERFIAVLLGTALFATCGCGNDTSDRFFSLPNDPPGTFIEARFHPHQGWYRGSNLTALGDWKSRHLTILGDGAAALRIERYQERFEIYEYDLSEEELAMLFDLVLKSSVMEHDPARSKKADIHKIGTRRRSREDWSGPSLTVHVLETNCPGRAPDSPVTAEVRPPVLRVGRRFGDPAIEALSELGELVSVIENKVSEQGNSFMQFNDGS